MKYVDFITQRLRDTYNGQFKKLNLNSEVSLYVLPIIGICFRCYMFGDNHHIYWITPESRDFDLHVLHNLCADKNCKFSENLKYITIVFLKSNYNKHISADNKEKKKNFKLNYYY